MAWYDLPGTDTDVVISTRVRCARNISGYPFPAAADAKTAREIIEKVSYILTSNGFSMTDFTDIPRAAAYSLVEKHYVSPGFVRVSLPHALFLNEPCGLSVMVCEEDHLRIQCILPGLALTDACAGADKVEGLLDRELDLAFNEQFGYLTQSPLNAGLAMRASIMVFLPGICLEGKMPALSCALDRLGLTMRGLFGEKSTSQGFLFQISNQTSACTDKNSVISLLSYAAEKIKDMERQSRASFSGSALDDLKDRIMRAYGTLKYACRISTEEFMSLWAYVRLGCYMGLVDHPTQESMTSMLIGMMPATLMLSCDTGTGEESDPDSLRARMVRERLDR